MLTLSDYVISHSVSVSVLRSFVGILDTAVCFCTGLVLGVLLNDALLFNASNGYFWFV